MKWVKVPRTIYPVTVYFCTGSTQEIMTKLKRLKLTPDVSIDKHCRGKELGWTLKMTDKNDCFAILVWVRSCKRTPRDIAILAHECQHVCYYVNEYIQLEQAMPTFADQELACYFLDHLVQSALVGLWKPQLNTVDF